MATNHKRRLLEYGSPNSFTPYARNARTHSDSQIAEIGRSIQEFGFTNPLLIDEKGVVIAGHGRLMAAQRLNMDEVPFIRLTGMTGAQRRALVLADNKIAANAGWDMDMLRLELSDLQKGGFDLGLTGFSSLELTDIFATKAGQTDPEDAPPLPTQAVTILGDVWILGPHRITCGDSTDADAVARALKGQSPQLMCTDPPYGVEYDPDWRNQRARSGTSGMGNRGIGAGAIGKVENDDRADWAQAFKFYAGDVAYCWHAGLRAATAMTALIETNFEVRAQIIWAKQQFAIGRGHYHFQHEPCYYAVRKGKTGRWEGGRKQSTLWEIDKPVKSETGHSTQKPIECMKRPIENHTKPGESVYDPFLGSGTTVIAAEMSGRACLGIELSPNYVDVAVKRWESFVGKQAILESTGKTFAQTAKERGVSLTNKDAAA